MLRPYKTVEELPFKKGDKITIRTTEEHYTDTFLVMGFQMKNELYIKLDTGSARVSFLCENFEILINGNWEPMGVEE